jgi:hypothetical protein
MTNQDIKKLKKYIKFVNVFDMLPVKIPNWLEKLSGKKVRGVCREFTESELGYIEAALRAISDQIFQTYTIGYQVNIDAAWESVKDRLNIKIG